MCGISGIYNFDDSIAVDAGVIKKMTDAIRHRGPDDEGFYVNKNIGLGVRRLSIIDLQKGHQPMFNEDRTIWIAYNGEIYNYKELTRILKRRGHIFYTNCDTETIVHLYEEYGENCVNHLNGMFALAIWDSNKRQVFLARDRLGIKPLYYTENNGRVIFASEIKSILQVENVKREVDPEAFSDYLALQYSTPPNTMFKGIRKVRPGHTVVIKNGKITEREYWDIHYPNVDENKDEYYIERFDELFKESIKRRLISDVPLGVLLSGGVDSSTVLALLSEMNSEQIKTFSVGCNVSGIYNEFKYARMVAKRFNTDHHEVLVEPKTFIEYLPKYIWHMDEPVADLASVPFFFVLELARKNVTVVLSGEGGDEVLNGYWFGGIAKRIDVIRKFQMLPKFIREGIPARLNSWIPNGVMKRIESANVPLEHRNLYQLPNLEKIFTEEEKLELSPYLTGQYSDSREKLRYFYQRSTAKDMLSQISYVYSKLWLPEDVLMKADKMSMANSVELRVPFLDHILVEFMASVPISLKVRKTWYGNYITKYILKEIISKKIPKEIIHRKKLGLQVPLGYWFRGALQDFVRDILLSDECISAGFFDGKTVENLINRHLKGEEDLSQKIKVLLVFELWRRTFLK